MPSFIECFAQCRVHATCSDDVEKIAMFAALRIGPFAGLMLAIGRCGQADIKAASCNIIDIADQPVTAIAPSIG